MYLGHMFIRRRLIVPAALALPALAVLPAAAGAAPAQTASVNGYGPAAVLAGMTEAQKVGQLFMVGNPATGPVSSATQADISTYHAGSAILTGRSSAGVTATHGLTGSLQGLATSAATDGVRLLVATDQEGGQVQVLSGRGFSAMPTALSQGQESVNQLRANAATWGSQLAAAGVNMDLAPVLDTVPQNIGAANQPIGQYDREYGYTPSAVTTAGMAFIRGMHQAGVSVCVKHFPGLGRASGNTDTTYGVTDGVTTSDDPYLQPYASAVSSGGAQAVMVSEAIYTQIDPQHQGVFSPTVMGSMLRSGLGFHGVIVSDSLEATAVTGGPAPLTAAQEAVDFISAGGDLALVTDPTKMPAMYNAVLSQAKSDPSFATLVNNAALTVLIAKQQTGLLGGTVAVASTGPQALTAFEENDARSLTARQETGGTWDQPVSLGGVLNSPPAAAALPGTATVDAAVLGSDNAIWMRGFANGAASGSWTSRGGTGSSPPAIAAGSGGDLALAVRGTDDAIWVRTYTPAAGWSSWASAGGLALDTPIGMTYAPSGDLDLFVTGTDQAVWETVLHGGHWSGWQGLGGLAAGGPAAVTVPGGPVEIVVQGTGGAAEERSYSGSWSAWTGLDGILTSSPAAAAPAAGTAVVTAGQTDGQLYQDSYASGAWSGWQQLPFG
jgi:beta-glucosidase-like glycosyl hydrolase